MKKLILKLELCIEMDSFDSHAENNKRICIERLIERVKHNEVKVDDLLEYVDIMFSGKVLDI
jgi:hypothetical protein